MVFSHHITSTEYDEIDQLVAIGFFFVGFPSLTNERGNCTPSNLLIRFLVIAQRRRTFPLFSLPFSFSLDSVEPTFTICWIAIRSSTITTWKSLSSHLPGLHAIFAFSCAKLNSSKMGKCE